MTDEVAVFICFGLPLLTIAGCILAIILGG